ncbi:MAG: hypothetical protein WBZ20_09705 [Nitrososphaeraceae archaeon]
MSQARVLDFPASIKIDNNNSSSSSNSTAGQQQKQGQGEQYHHRILYIANFGFLSSIKHLVPKVALLKAGLGSTN